MHKFKRKLLNENTKGIKYLDIILNMASTENIENSYVASQSCDGFPLLKAVEKTTVRLLETGFEIQKAGSDIKMNLTLQILNGLLFSRWARKNVKHWRPRGCSMRRSIQLQPKG